MQIVLKPSQTVDKNYTLIELQGTVAFSTNDVEEFGELYYEQDIPFLNIGFHTLEGRRVKIAKPFAIMRHIKDSKDWEIFGIIKEKLIFDKRPQMNVKKSEVAQTLY